MEHNVDVVIIGAGTAGLYALSQVIHNRKSYLIVQNGEGKASRVTSAVIYLNGQRVVGPAEFNKKADWIAKPVLLEEQNEIATQLAENFHQQLINCANNFFSRVDSLSQNLRSIYLDIFLSL